MKRFLSLLLCFGLIAMMPCALADGTGTPFDFEDFTWTFYDYSEYKWVDRADGEIFFEISIGNDGTNFNIIWGIGSIDIFDKDEDTIDAYCIDLAEETLNNYIQAGIDVENFETVYAGVNYLDGRQALDLLYSFNVGKYELVLEQYLVNAGDGTLTFTGSAMADHYEEIEMNFDRIIWKPVTINTVAHVAQSGDKWTCPECGTVNEGNFCHECGTPKPTAPVDEYWFCSECGTENSGNFCTECGAPKPPEQLHACPNCGWEIPEGSEPNYCAQCGTKLK